MKTQRSTTSHDRFGASSATTELDDLMNQLDDLKLPTGPQEVPVSDLILLIMIELQNKHRLSKYITRHKRKVIE
jgi:hypothetical protein